MYEVSFMRIRKEGGEQLGLYGINLFHKEDSVLVPLFSPSSEVFTI